MNKELSPRDRMRELIIRALKPEIDALTGDEWSNITGACDRLFSCLAHDLADGEFFRLASERCLDALMVFSDSDELSQASKWIFVNDDLLRLLSHFCKVNFCKATGDDPLGWLAPSFLRFNPRGMSHPHLKRYQEQIFHAIVGPFTRVPGSRDRPYSWLERKIEDANSMIKLRTFLLAIYHAAKKSREKPGDYPICPTLLRESVKIASHDQVDILNRKNPWLKDLMPAFAHIRFPCRIPDVQQIFMDFHNDGGFPPGVVELITKLAMRGVPDDLLHVLGHLGIFRRGWEEEIYIAEVYRIGFGMKENE